MPAKLMQFWEEKYKEDKNKDAQRVKLSNLSKELFEGIENAR